MELGLRTPLLDAFRRGDVARDVRLSAAQGQIAPRPVEQLGLLMLLTADADEEIRVAAEQTLARLDEALLSGFIARSDTPAELREFFVTRGIEPSETPSTDASTPLVDDDETVFPEETGVPTERATVAQQLADMSVPQKVKAAMKGTREMRAFLIRDPNRMVASAVLSCPKLTEQEVETFARMGNVTEDVLRTIAQTRGWVKNYGVALGLVKNAKTPVAVSLNLLQRLNDRDIHAISTDRNVPDPLRIAARKRVAIGQK